MKCDHCGFDAELPAVYSTDAVLTTIAKERISEAWDKCFPGNYKPKLIVVDGGARLDVPWSTRPLKEIAGEETAQCSDPAQ